MTDTTGKVITLNLGAVVTDTGAGICNGKRDSLIRDCIADDGTRYLILARVVRDTPRTYRRAVHRGY